MKVISFVTVVFDYEMILLDLLRFEIEYYGNAGIEDF